MDKNSILAKMQEDKNKLEQQIEVIKNLEIKPVTQEEWMKLCETPVRHSNIILDIAKVTFPNGYDFKRDSNYISFYIDGFNIEVSIHRSDIIKIDSKWYKHEYKDYEKPTKHYLKMRRYFELLDSGKYSWYDLAYCRNNCANSYSKFGLFVWWFTKAKWHKVDREVWEERFKIDDEFYNQKIKDQQNKMKSIEECKPKFIECAKELSKFGQVHTRMNFNGLYGALVTVEEFISAMNK